MKRKILFLPLILALPLLNGCNPNGQESSSIVLLNSFESLGDLYNFKTANTDSKNEVKYDINKDVQYIKDGNGSLKIDINKGEVTNLIFPFKRNNKALFKFNDLHSLEADVYNDSSNVVTINNVLYTNGLVTLLKEDQNLAPKSWNHISFTLSALAIENNYENLSGFEIKIISPNPVVLYLDKVSVATGLTYSEEDKLYQQTIKELQTEINALPDEISISDYENLEVIYKKYQSLPTLFKRIVSNYNLLVSKLEDLATIIDLDKPLADGTTVYDYDKFYGIGEIKNHPSTGGDCEFFYQDDIKFDNEEGAVRVDFNGKTENYLGYLYPQNLTKYDYLIYHIYFDDVDNPDKRIVYFGWEHAVTVEANVWTTVKVDPTWLTTATWGIIVVQVAEGTSVSSTGSMYLGSVYGKLSSFTDVDSALNNDSPISTRGVENQIIIDEEKNIEVTAKNNGLLNIRFNKKYTILSTNEAAYFNFNAGFDGVLSLVGFDGKVLENINFNGGWTTISLDNTLYEKVYSIELNINNGQVIKIADFIVYKTSEVNLANMIIKSRYKLDISEPIDSSRVPELISTINEFETLTPEQLRVLSKYNPNVSNKINLIKSKLILGSPNLITQYITNYLDTYDVTTIPMILISIANIDFVKNNISIELKSRLNNLVDMFKVSYGEHEPPKTGIDYPWDGNIVKAFDTNKGNVYNINISKMNFKDYLDIEMGYLDIDGCSTIAFELYNPMSYDVTMVYYNVNSGGAWETVLSTNLKHGVWNHIEMQANKVTGARNFICLCNSNLVSSGWKITNYYGIKYEKYANDTINAINDLPLVVSTEIEKMKVLSAKSMYDALSDDVKPYVTNYSKLASLLPINNLYTASEMKSGWSGIFATRVYTEYGLAGRGTPTVNGNNLYKVFENTELQQLIQFDHNIFYIYVPEGYTSVMFFLQYDQGWGGKSQNLISGAWNRIQISGDEWFNNQPIKTGKTYCYLNVKFDGDAPTNNWFLTSVYGYND